MKRFFVLLILLVVAACFALSPITASAEQGDFLKIESESVGFYFSVYNESADSYQMILQFYLPLGTYAKRLDSSRTNHYEVSYNGIHGYVKKTEIADTLYTDIAQPYSNTAITLNSSAKVYRDEINSADNFLLPSGDTLMYIGKIISGTGTIWYAVKRSDSVDHIYFVKESEVYTPQSEPENEDTQPAEAPQGDAVKILLIIGIVIPAVIIVFLLFKPRKRKRYSARYMDEAPRRRYDDDYYDDYDDYYNG